MTEQLYNIRVKMSRTRYPYEGHGLTAEAAWKFIDSSLAAWGERRPSDIEDAEALSALLTELTCYFHPGDRYSITVTRQPNQGPLAALSRNALPR